MVRKKSIGEQLFNIFNIILMLGIIVITVYPMYYVLMGSFSDGSRLMETRGLLLKPQGFSLGAYKAVLSNPNIMTGYRTTLIVVVVGTALSVFLTAIGAFVVTRREFPIAKPIMYMMIFTMYFGGGMIPTYLVVNNYYHMGDSLLALIIPSAVSVYNLIIMKSNFQALPASLEEAAKIDGANDIRILFQIILPLSKAVLAVMVLYYGVGHWNSWFDAMMYIRTKSKYPLQIILRDILLASEAQGMTQGGSTGDKFAIGECIKYATIIFATLPIMCLYPFIQKYFVKGVMIGAVKG